MKAVVFQDERKAKANKGSGPQFKKKPRPNMSGASLFKVSRKSAAKSTYVAHLIVPFM
jgi:hypothetical protein